jgi:hypothetical protein
VAESTTAALGTCRRNGDAGGDGGLLRSIPLAGRLRTGWRSSLARRRGRGRRGVVVLGDGHGGELGHALGKKNRGAEGSRGSEGERLKERRKEGSVGVPPGGLLVDRRKQEVAGRSARKLHAGACLVEEETKGVFAHSPLDFGKI